MDIILRLLFNLIAIAGVIAIVSNLDAVKRPFVISLAIFNMVIFCLSLIFKSQELSLGSGLGLFALFTLIRYRSEPLRIMELSYILICACLGIMNAIYPASWAFWQLFVLNFSLLGIISLGLKWLAPVRDNENSSQNSYKIRYNQLDLLKPDNRAALLSDLEGKLGVKIRDIQIESINYAENYASLKVYVREEEQQPIEKEDLNDNLIHKLFYQVS